MSNRFAVALWFAFLLIHCCHSQAEPTGGQEEQYARYLVAEGDFFRAASRFKELAYFADTDSLRFTYLLWTGRCERWRGETNASIRYASHVANNAADFPLLLHEAYLDLGIIELQRGQTLFARSYLRRAKQWGPGELPEIFLAIVAMREGDWASCSSLLRVLKSDGSDIHPVVVVVDSMRELGAEAPYKNPVVASALSTFLPGAGQAYSYHYIDGIQAFTLVGAFAYMSFVAYRYEQNRHGHPGGLFAVSVGITSIFHLANVLGANKTAHYHNMRLMMDPVNAAFNAVDGYYKKTLLEQP